MPANNGQKDAKAMGNKAKNDKGSILIDLENLLDVFEPAFMRMPKIRRIHGAAVRMEDAAYDIIHYFTIAYEMGTDEAREKRYYVNQLLGAYGRMQSCFKRLMKVDIDTMKSSSEECKGRLCLFSDSTKLEIAKCMERIEEGIVKWRKSIRVPSSCPCDGRPTGQEAARQYN